MTLSVVVVEACPRCCGTNASLTPGGISGENCGEVADAKPRLVVRVEPGFLDGCWRTPEDCVGVQRPADAGEHAAAAGLA